MAFLYYFCYYYYWYNANSFQVSGPSDSAASLNPGAYILRGFNPMNNYSLK